MLYHIPVSAINIRVGNSLKSTAQRVVLELFLWDQYQMFERMGRNIGGKKHNPDCYTEELRLRLRELPE